MRRLPAGIQNFGNIRQEGYVYVDKTAGIHRLATGSGKYFFLSRPRRFGKSLLCSTLQALFAGRRELFGPIAGQPALAVDSLPWDWKTHPVVHLDLNTADFTSADALTASLRNGLENAARQAGMASRGVNVSDQFLNLLQDLHGAAGEKAAVLIDEYDKPMLDTIDKPALHEQVKETLKIFYGVLKSSDEHLSFVLLTGITKFSQVSVFSALNNLTDLTLNPHYADLCGITQDELERDFAPEIDAVVAAKPMDRREYLAKMKNWYNGYRFSIRDVTVYSPYGLLLHFTNDGMFEKYWYETGTPTFLVKLIEEQKIDVLDIEKKTIRKESLARFNTDNMDAVSVLFQSGYLTIAGYDDEWQEYTLDYPNEEVRTAFTGLLLAHYTRKDAADLNGLAKGVIQGLAAGDVDGAMEALRSILAGVPYDIQIRQERYYQTLVHLTFRMLGMYCSSEVKTAAGRIDTQVQVKGRVYCFEFKLAGTAADALAQIDTKEYLLPWNGSGKKLVKVGVGFDWDKRNIADWRVAAA